MELLLEACVDFVGRALLGRALHWNLGESTEPQKVLSKGDRGESRERGSNSVGGFVCMESRKLVSGSPSPQDSAKCTFLLAFPKSVLRLN